MENLATLKEKESEILKTLEDNRKAQKAAELAEKDKDKPKTFEEACLMIKVDSKKEILEELPDHVKAYMQLVIIAKALNNDWTPDWNNGDQKKWYPFFDMRGAFGFSCTDCGSWCTATDGGSRLCFKTEELAEYAGRTFEGVYKQFMVI